MAKCQLVHLSVEPSDFFDFPLDLQHEAAALITCMHFCWLYFSISNFILKDFNDIQTHINKSLRKLFPEASSKVEFKTFFQNLMKSSSYNNFYKHKIHMPHVLSHTSRSLSQRLKTHDSKEDKDVQQLIKTLLQKFNPKVNYLYVSYQDKKGIEGLEPTHQEHLSCHLSKNTSVVSGIKNVSPHSDVGLNDITEDFNGLKQQFDDSYECPYSSQEIFDLDISDSDDETDEILEKKVKHKVYHNMKNDESQKYVEDITKQCTGPIELGDDVHDLDLQSDDINEISMHLEAQTLTDGTEFSYLSIDEFEAKLYDDLDIAEGQYSNDSNSLNHKDTESYQAIHHDDLASLSDNIYFRDHV